MKNLPTISQIYSEAHDISSLYRKRIINEKLRKDTTNLLLGFYKNIDLNKGKKQLNSALNVSNFELPDLRILTLCAEILDIFSAFGEIDLGHIFRWIKKESENIYSIIVTDNKNLKRERYELEPKLRLEQIRFAALHLIERYRSNKREKLKYANEFQALINIIENDDAFDADSVINHKHNVLSYLYFWLGKCHRSLDYIEAKRCYENSESHLFHIVTNAALKRKIEKSKDTEEARESNMANLWLSDIDFDVPEILYRISLITLAKAQLAVMMGRIKDARILVEKAKATCAESDLLAKAYADFISGTCLRYLSERKNPDKEKAIMQLKSAYDVFVSTVDNGIPQLRHIIRTMRELVLTLIIKGDLDEAKEILDNIEKKALSDDSLFKKLKGKYLWRFYNQSLRSRIARKEGVRDNNSALIDKAVEHAKKAINELSESRNLESSEIFDGKFALGEAYFAANNYELAGSEFKEIIKLNSTKTSQQQNKNRKSTEAIRRNYEHPEISAICYLFLSRISKESNKEKEAQKYLVKFREIEARGQIENFWVFDLKEQIENNQKCTINIEIRKERPLDIQPDEKLHTYYKRKFMKSMFEIALDLHGNNIQETAEILEYERCGFSNAVKELLPTLKRTRKRKQKQKLINKQIKNYVNE